MRFSGKVALVTGSSRNIGKSVAGALAREGAAVVLNASTSADELDATAAELRGQGYRVLPQLADVGKREQVTAMVDRTLAELGAIDILVMSHSVRPVRPLLDVSADEWSAVQDVNLNSAFHLCQAVLPGMVERGGGAIVALGGNTNRLAGARRAHVFASLAGRTALLRCAMQEFAPAGVRVNFVHPGITDTVRKHPEWYPDSPADPQHDPQLLKTIPARRAGTPDEVAAAVVWLASDEAAYVNGATIAVTGGWGV